MSDDKKTDNDNDDNFDEDVQEDEREELDEDTTATVYLKEIAEDGFNTPWDKIAQQMEIPKKQADSIIKKLVQMMVVTHSKANFPKDIINHYNQFAPRDDDRLTTDDIVVLMKLTNRFIDKITPQQQELIHTKMKKLVAKSPTPNTPHRRFDPRENAQPIPEVPAEQQQHEPMADHVTMSDSYNSAGGPPASMGENPMPNQGQQNNQDQYSPYESEEALLKYLLEMNYSIRDPERIKRFLLAFRMNKNDWLANPIKMFVALNTAFPRAAAEATMMQFQDSRAKMPNNAGALYKITGASSYQPIVDPQSYLGRTNPAMGEFINQFANGMNPNVNPNGLPNQMGMPTFGAGGEVDPLDKELTRLSKIMSMGMMRQMAEKGMGGNGQQAEDPYSDVHEIYDNAGRLTEKRYVKRAPYPYGVPPQGQQPSSNDKSQETFMKFIELMMTSQNQDRNLLMQKVLQGEGHGMNEIVATMLKQTMGAMSQQIDPVNSLNKFLELGDKVAQLKQQPQKTTEEKRLEMDYFLAKEEMRNKEAEKAREFQRQQDEARSADERYQDTVKSVGDIIKEAAGPAIEIFKNTLGRGLGGNMPGMFPPGAGQGMPPQGQQRVVVREVPTQQVPQQQQGQQGQPQYTPEQIALLQQEEMRRQQAMQAQMQRQQQEDNRPIEEVLKEIPDDQLEEMSGRFQEDMIRLEHTGNKVMTELARRKGRGFTPSRQHVPPIVEAIAEHEQSQARQQQAQQQQYYQPEEPSINPFEDVDDTANTGATSSAVDFSNSYNDPNVRDALIDQGLLSEDDRENESQLSVDENQSVGVPASSSLPPTKERESVSDPVQQEPVIEIDESALAEESDTVIEQ